VIVSCAEVEGMPVLAVYTALSDDTGSAERKPRVDVLMAAPAVVVPTTPGLNDPLIVIICVLVTVNCATGMCTVGYPIAGNCQQSLMPGYLLSIES
jgi:hypothetical protein